MEKEKKWKMYPRDIIFAVVSLAALVYAIINYVKSPALMPLFKEYACLCGFGCLMSFTCMHGTVEEVAHFWFTHILSTVIWCVASISVYAIMEPVVWSHILFLIPVYLIFLPAEFLVMGVVSLETRSAKEFADGPRCRCRPR